MVTLPQNVSNCQLSFWSSGQSMQFISKKLGFKSHLPPQVRLSLSQVEVLAGLGSFMRSVHDSLDRVGLRQTSRGGAADPSRSDLVWQALSTSRFPVALSGGVSEEGRRDSICEGDDWPPGQTVFVIPIKKSSQDARTCFCATGAWTGNLCVPKTTTLTTVLQSWYEIFVLC